MRVFPQAEGQIGCAGGGEFCCAMSSTCCWSVAECGGDGVDGVGGEVGTHVEGEDEGEGLGEEEVLRTQEEGFQGLGYAAA